MGASGLCGCRREAENTSATTQPIFDPTPVSSTATMPAQYPESLRSNPDPVDVVSVFLAAVAAQDDPTLIAFVPKDRAIQALKQLVLLRGLQDRLDTEHAVAMTLESWKHKLGLFEKGSLEPYSAADPDAENRVVVTVRGRDAQSAARYLVMVTLLRERNLWKVDPELEIAQELAPLDSLKPRRPAKPSSAPATSSAPAGKPSAASQPTR